MKVRVTSVLRIPGRGTVLVIESVDEPLTDENLRRGDMICVDSHNILIRAVERHAGDTKNVGLVVADAIMPSDIERALPINASIRVSDIPAMEEYRDSNWANWKSCNRGTDWQAFCRWWYGPERYDEMVKNGTLPAEP